MPGLMRAANIALLLSIGMTLAAVGNVAGQTYPTKPIRIVTGGPGGGADFASRVMAAGLAGSLGQQVVVDNRGGVIPGEIVSQSAPDGYTLLCYPGSLWIGSLMQKTPYDPLRDFAPISMLVTSPILLVVHPSVPVKTIKELIALAKTRPGALNYSAAGTGGASHLAGELFKAMAGVDIVLIPYKGAGAAITDVVGGQVHMTFGNAASVAPHLKSGRLRALAVTSAQPSALAPGVPTIAASGVPGYEAVQNTGMFAPARTPEAIITRLHHEILRILNNPGTREKLMTAGVESVASTPAELVATMKQEMHRLGKVIKDAGIRAE